MSVEAVLTGLGSLNSHLVQTRWRDLGHVERGGGEAQAAINADY